MNSMTGYGRATTQVGASIVTVQVNAVNRKALDLSVSLPEQWESLETDVTQRVRAVAARGKVHVDFDVTSGGSSDWTWDDAAAREVLDRLAEFAAQQGVAFQPTPELLWQVANSQRRTAELPPADVARATLLEALEEALRGFGAMRAREGEALLVDFLKRLQLLRQHVDGIASRAPAVPAAYRETLHKRLREAGLELDLNDERVLKEIALFADRCDISEEITRFRSHFDQFAALLKSPGEIGRKAEFILQEMGREVHTMGSKANDLTIARHVIELKNELERIREQMANVE